MVGGGCGCLCKVLTAMGQVCRVEVKSRVLPTSGKENTGTTKTIIIRNAAEIILNSIEFYECGA